MDDKKPDFGEPVAEEFVASSPKRKVITLSLAAATKTEELSALMGGVSSAEVVRRGLSLLSLWLSLDDKEDLMIRRADNSLDRVVMWE